MKLITYMLPILIWSFGSPLLAQTDQDALRYSRWLSGGTSRSIGAGNAFGALGADFSAMSNNPAGIGVYRRSEIVFSTSLDIYNNDATFAGNTENERDSRFTIWNAGMIFARTSSGRDWKAFNFGVGLSKRASLDNSSYYEGSSKGSIVEQFVANANGTLPGNLNPITGKLVYDAYLIDNVNTPEATEYEGVLDENSTTYKKESIRGRGGINDLNFTFAGNYDNKIYIGGSAGFSFVRYSETKNYTETDTEDAVPNFQSLSYNQQFRTNGTGFNLKLGMIYRANKYLRVGMAFHSPTFYSFDDRFTNSVGADLTYDNGIDPPVVFNDEVEQQGVFDYELTTPWRVQASTAFLFGKHGFLSAEVEVLDYAQSRFQFGRNASTEDKDYERELNDVISEKYGPSVNLKIGGEFAYEVFRFRAGYNAFTSPFSGNLTTTSSIYQTISAGIGLRGKRVYADLAYVHGFGESDYLPYTLSSSPNQQLVQNSFVANNIVATIGLRF